MQGPQQQSYAEEPIVDLEKERKVERLAQLGAMEAEVGKLRAANKRGDMGSMMRGRDGPHGQVEEGSQRPDG